MAGYLYTAEIIMAIVYTTFQTSSTNMTMEVVPYMGAGDMDKVNTPIPRAEINFIVTSGAITISGVGDTQELRFICALPNSYAYVVQEISIFQLYGDDIDAWENWGACRIKNNQSGKTWAHSMDLWSRGEYNKDAIGSKNYHLSSPGELNRLIIPGVGGANLQVTLSNVTTDQSAMVVDGFLARFLQFDINQAYFFGANTPVPIR